MKNLSITQKKWWLTAHILFSAIWFGVTVTFLILSISVLTTNDSQVIKAYYTSMLQMEQTAGRASLIGTVITGLILSIFTKWGLFKFYWIITKEILTFICLVLGFFLIYYWTLNGIHLSEESIGDHFMANHYQLMIWIIIQVILLAIIFIVSVFKPWGKSIKRQ
ncbi:hypothetical protein P5G62_007075 [Neobacillus sp. 179-C4.2 HS]|uniref:DUF2269 domain-containing protein n=1 Tax=Neobacillus driksii TaxID=3035913 RepID=A0ABV4YQ47_9BACI|nr:hypothetical protein [Neobacillus sp. 179.-C4.2 HS]MDP5195471.1 hypothetical protein [Neobacillus sp. 179.-C4.2 HS]